MWEGIRAFEETVSNLKAAGWASQHPQNWLHQRETQLPNISIQCISSLQSICHSIRCHSIRFWLKVCARGRLCTPESSYLPGSKNRLSWSSLHSHSRSSLGSAVTTAPRQDNVAPAILSMKALGRHSQPGCQQCLYKPQLVLTAVSELLPRTFPTKQINGYF